MAFYFTADTHFGHTAILRYCKRPFETVEEMDETIFENWSKTIRCRDTVFHLGDVAFGNREYVFKTVERLRRLPGTKYLIPGNHDVRHADLIAIGFKQVLPPIHEQVFTFFRANLSRTISQYIVMSHYPMVTWNEFFNGSLHLFGHVHGRLRENNRRIDVGVNKWDFAPVELEALLEKLEKSREYTNPEILPSGKGEDDPDGEKIKAEE